MDTDAARIVEALHHNASTLRDADLTRLGDAEFRAMWLLFEKTCLILTGFVANRMITEVAARNLALVTGFRALVGYLKTQLRLSGSEAHRRVRDAAELAERTGPTGEPLPARHPHISAAQHEGAITVEHAHAVLDVLRRIPRRVEPAERENAEQVLTTLARESGPEQVRIAGARVLAYLDPDGSVTDDVDRARRRGLRIGRQDFDLMSRVTGELDPATRALLDVVLAKWAAPGANNFEDPHSPRGNLDQPDVDPALLEAAAGRDHRTREQRNHDALKALLLWALNSGGHGEHNGLPMHLVVTMSLRDLEDETGVATTATGAVVPVADVLATAARKRAYLLLFDHRQRPLHFFHQQRSANLDQRLVLFATERGCTRPGCLVPATGCQTHHRRYDHQHGSSTGIHDLALVCPHDHRQLDANDGINTPTGWHTRAGRSDGPNPGRTQWIPPAVVDPDRRAQVNNTHHPDRLLAQAEAHLHPTTEQPTPTTQPNHNNHDHSSPPRTCQHRTHTSRSRP